MMSVLISQTALAAAPVCFNDKTSYEAVKTQLPPILQRTPVTLVSATTGLNGGIKVDFVGEKMQVTGTYQILFGRVNSNSAYVEKVCVNGSNISIRTSGQNYAIQQQGNQFVVTNSDGTANFASTTVANYNAVVNQLRGTTTRSMASIGDGER